MRTLTFLLATLLALNSTASASPRPRLKAPATNLRLRATCPLNSGNCRVILSWTRPVNYSSLTDTAHVKWNQLTPTALFIDSGATRGAADTVFIDRPAPGLTKTGVVKLCYSRIGWSGLVCNGTVAWSADNPITPPDTSTGLKVSGLIIKPDNAPVTLADWKAVGVWYHDSLTLRDSTNAILPWTCPSGGAGKCPQKQFCAFVVRSDGAIGMTSNSAPILACRPYYDSLPGHLPTYTPIQFHLAPGERPPVFKVAVTNGEVTDVAINGQWCRHALNGDWIVPKDMILAIR